jgi:hypothetical protein
MPTTANSRQVHVASAAHGCDGSIQRASAGPRQLVKSPLQLFRLTQNVAEEMCHLGCTSFSIRQAEHRALDKRKNQAGLRFCMHHHNAA